MKHLDCNFLSFKVNKLIQKLSVKTLHLKSNFQQLLNYYVSIGYHSINPRL